MPKGRLTINLAPADIKKEGPSFDLPIAIGILAAQGFIPRESLPEYGMVGELALSGEVRRARGVLPITIAMKKEGRKMIIVPWDNADEAAVVEGIKVFPVKNLHEAADLIGGISKPKQFRINLKKNI
jgi:magnesium chelatase family protein